MKLKPFLLLACSALTVACQASLTPVTASCGAPASTGPTTAASSQLASSASPWGRVYTGNYAQQAEAILPLPDKSLLLVGWSEFQNTARRDQDAWVMKLDAQGNPLWSKLYGGQQDDHARAVLAAHDGCYLVGGFTSSPRGGAWVFEINGKGETVWNRVLGAGARSEVNVLVPARDGGYLVAGTTNYDSFPSSDAWVAKLDASGSLLWNRVLGGAGGDVISGIAATTAGYVLAGYTTSLGAGEADAWLVQLDEAGSVVWNQTFGGPQDDTASAIVSAADGGFIVVGGTDDFHAWVFKLDAGGAVVWSRTLNANEIDTLYGLARSAADGYVATGATHTAGEGAQPWILALTEEGQVLWSKRYEALQDTGGTVIQNMPEGGYLVAGGPGTNLHQAWILRTGENGDLDGDCGGVQSQAVESADVILAHSSVSMPRSSGDAFAVDTSPPVQVGDLKAQVKTICPP